MFTISNIIYSLEGMVNKIPRIIARVKPEFTKSLQLVNLLIENYPKRKSFVMVCPYKENDVARIGAVI